jgi:hypothetical protein
MEGHNSHMPQANCRWGTVAGRFSNTELEHYLRGVSCG